MTLYDLATLINKQIEILHRPSETLDSSSLWYAKLDDVEIKDGAILSGSFGNGRTPEEALQNYVKELKGQKIVIDAFSKDKRTVLDLPSTLTLK